MKLHLIKLNKLNQITGARLQRAFTMQQEPQNLIDIPTITNQDMFESNRERADNKNLDHCPCCGKAITNPKYFINSIFGGMAYPSSDNNNYNNSWMMGVGSECRKKFPNGYVFTINK